MTDTPYRDGHCSPTDQYHALCPHHIRTQFGVRLECSCPAHHNDKEESAE